MKSTEHLTHEKLAEIRAYCEKATAGPWEAGNGAVWNCIVNGEGNSPAEICYQMRDQDADFIANARTDLPAAVEEISRLRELTMAPKVTTDGGLFSSCGHNAYWITHYDTCMACRAKAAESERDTLRQQLAEAKGENADLRERLQRQREQIQRQPAHVCGPDENCGVCIECALMAQGAELERVSQDLQQANAASRVYAEIRAEQEHGRAKYGSGPDDLAHDDANSDSLWNECIHAHLLRASDATPMERRQHLIKVAGLAISAVESFDRKRAVMEGSRTK